MRAADSPLAFKAFYAGTKVGSGFSTRVAGWFAHKLWFTPWQVKPGERGLRRQTEWLAGTSPVSFDTSHGRIAGFEAGSGPTVLLVHGWGERSASLGAFIGPLTSAGYRVVGIDLPGHGDSVTSEPNLYVVADVIREVARRIGDVTAVVGHSMGGHSTMVALRDGLEVDSVVLLSPSSRLAQALTRFEELLSLPPRAKTGLKRKLERRFGTTLWSETEGSALVRNVTVPALVVHDRDDPQVPLTDSELLVAAWPAAQLMTTGSLGHGRILRDEQVVTAALSFVTQNHVSTGRELEDANR